MQLQMNNSGAWRNVVQFKATQERVVRQAAENLAVAGGIRGFRIVDEGIAVAHCLRPDYIWVDG